MREPEDDTTEPGQPSGCEREQQKPGGYYYDDSTGYEVYDPEKEEDEEDEDLETRAHALCGSAAWLCGKPTAFRRRLL